MTEPGKEQELSAELQPRAETSPEFSARVPSPEDSEIRRQKKLIAIQKAVDSGAYDSDELLERSLLRMIENLRKTQDEGSESV